MTDRFENDFTIKTDTSACTSLAAGHDDELNDTWYYSDRIFRSGRIYGLVSEYGQGCAYLSYLLGGRIEYGAVNILCNSSPVRQKTLADVSWNLEPYNEDYGKKNVRRSIEKALMRRPDKESFEEVAENFC